MTRFTLLALAAALYLYVSHGAADAVRDVLETFSRHWP